MDNVNSVIDNLANKLGITVQYLIPELSRYVIVKDITTIVLLSLLIVVSLYAIYFIRKKWKIDEEGDNYFDESPYVVGMIVAGIIGFFLLIVVITDIVEISGFIASPTGAVVKMILNDLQKGVN